MQPADWELMLKIAHDQRLLPWLHWQLTRDPSRYALPPSAADVLAAEFRRSTLRSLQLQADVVRLHRLLTRAKINHIFLKGVFLAFQAYPHPALRPMRDIDILVDPGRVLEAFQLLLDAGMTRNSRNAGNPEAASEARHHLPGLRTPAGILVELHNRLLPPHVAADGRGELEADQSFWSEARTASLGSEQIPVESPEDLLLHLIVHACVQHEFDNGPLLLPDLAFLLMHRPINWTRFWVMARERRYMRACGLALKMMQRSWDVPVTWPEDQLQSGAKLPPELVTAVLRLMLRDPAQRRAVTLGGTFAAAPTISKRVNIVLSKVFVSRQRLAAEYPVAKDSPWIWGWHLVRWTDRLGHYLKQFKSLRHLQTQHEMLEVGRLRRWLAD